MGAEHCHIAGCNCKAGQRDMLREHAVNLNALGTKRRLYYSLTEISLMITVCASPRLKDKLGV